MFLFVLGFFCCKGIGCISDVCGIPSCLLLSTKMEYGLLVCVSFGVFGDDMTYIPDAPISG